MIYTASTPQAISMNWDLKKRSATIYA